MWFAFSLCFFSPSFPQVAGLGWEPDRGNTSNPPVTGDKHRRGTNSFRGLCLRWAASSGRELQWGDPSAAEEGAHRGELDRGGAAGVSPASRSAAAQLQKRCPRHRRARVSLLCGHNRHFHRLQLEEKTRAPVERRALPWDGLLHSQPHQIFTQVLWVDSGAHALSHTRSHRSSFSQMFSLFFILLCK